MLNDNVCIPCRAGMHDECLLLWIGALEDCCCHGRYTLRDHYKQLVAEDQDVDPDGYAAPTVEGAKINGQVVERKRGNSGYISPQAWPGNANIGELTDAESTGRKRAKKMYPIKAGYVCEWAGLESAGGGVFPIRGCINNPASDWHHGPDKNTLNNEKASWGVGEAENVHLICSWCHNMWHAMNDPFYAQYERNVDQALPFLPVAGQPWSVHDPDTKASMDDLLEGLRKRKIEEQNHGSISRGRSSHTHGAADTSFAAD